MYFTKTPPLLRAVAHQFLWRIPTDRKAVYLTFDDGPTPVITEKVLEILQSKNALGTFFCIGKNAVNHPEIIEKIKSGGHSIGNHTHHHLNGWKSGYAQYLRDTLHANEVLQTRLFRPPYGRITRSQSRALQHKFDIVMWDVLSGDFDAQNSVEGCIQNVIHAVKPGSIVVMHDSMKASPILLQALPEILDILHDKGFTFEAIPQHHAR
jgi:peptidoglycan/xylan/chitin deacetylase (PgdA/CDA1 family)